MTKYQIISPTGVKVCVIEAVSKVTLNTGIYFYDQESAGFKIDGWIAEIPAGWVAMPLNVIIKEENGD